MANKYSFDSQRKREISLEYKGMDHSALKEKSEDIHQDIDEKLRLAKQFEQDKLMIEEQINTIYNSDLSYEDKREQLYMMKEMIQVLKDEYAEQVEKNVEKKQEQAQEIFDVLQNHAEVLHEQAEKMEQVHLKTGGVHLKEAIAETRRMEETFKDIKELENKKVERVLDKISTVSKEMRKNRTRSI